MVGRVTKCTRLIIAVTLLIDGEKRLKFRKTLGNSRDFTILTFSCVNFVGAKRAKFAHKEHFNKTTFLVRTVLLHSEKERNFKPDELTGA